MKTRVIQIEPMIFHAKEDEGFEAGEGSHVRVIGCDGHRQCLVEHFHGTLRFVEKGREKDHVVIIPLDDVFRKCFTALIKANDGMDEGEALENAMSRLITYEQAHG